LATTRGSGLRGDRFLGLLLFAVRLRLVLAFLAFRDLAMIAPLISLSPTTVQTTAAAANQSA
jgi:hypothetical protein